jgi:hypothetical protein
MIRMKTSETIVRRSGEIICIKNSGQWSVISGQWSVIRGVVR